MLLHSLSGYDGGKSKNTSDRHGTWSAHFVSSVLRLVVISCRLPLLAHRCFCIFFGENGCDHCGYGSYGGKSKNTSNRHGTWLALANSPCFAYRCFAAATAARARTQAFCQLCVWQQTRHLVGTFQLCFASGLYSCQLSRERATMVFHVSLAQFQAVRHANRPRKSAQKQCIGSQTCAPQVRNCAAKIPFG